MKLELGRCVSVMPRPTGQRLSLVTGVGGELRDALREAFAVFEGSMSSAARAMRLVIRERLP